MHVAWLLYIHFNYKALFCLPLGPLSCKIVATLLYNKFIFLERLDTLHSSLQHVEYLGVLCLYEIPTTEIVNKITRQPLQWEKIFTNRIFYIALKFKICNQLKNLKKSKPNKSVKKWAKEISRQFPKDEIQLAITHTQFLHDKDC